MLLHQSIYIFEKTGDSISEICYQFKDIDFLELGSVLLKSWISINGLSKGNRVTTKIDYNTVNNNIILPILSLIRFNQKKMEKCIDEKQLNKLSYLADIDYKYYSYSIENLPADENLIYCIYQKEICKKVLKSVTYRLSPTHSTILTDKEIIIISEEYHKLKQKKVDK